MSQNMAYGNKLGKYQVGRTIGEGTFAKVKLAVDTTNGNQVAIKIMDKNMVMQSDLKNQVNLSTFLEQGLDD